MQVRTATLALLIAAAPPSLHGALAQERWDPVSKTASSITGPISIFRDHLRFGTGTTLPVAVTGRPTDMELDGQVMSVTVYRVLTPRDPLLLRDNALCGIGPASWILAGARGNDRALAVYTGITAPPENKRLCGTFHYEVVPR